MNAEQIQEGLKNTIKDMIRERERDCSASSGSKSGDPYEQIPVAAECSNCKAYHTDYVERSLLKHKRRCDKCGELSVDYSAF